MASIERKRVTLHPLKEDGSVDPRTCLYPKTFVDGIVDRNGNEVDIATQEELDLANTKITSIESTISEEVIPTLATKQDELVSGVNIKTINNQPILGDGNIEVATDLSNYVDRSSDQTIEGDKTFENITIHNDTAVFNGEAIIRGNLLDQEGKVIPLKELSFANSLENGGGNSSLIQTNIALSNVEWSSSDESVAIVDQEGNIEAVGIGEATITAIKEGAEATCDVTVTAPLRRLLRKAPGSDIGLDGYEIITSTSEISSSDQIYMIAIDADAYKKQFGGIDGNIGSAVDIETGVELSIPLTIEQVEDEDYYTISYEAGTLWCGSNKTLRVSNNITENSKWAISFSENNAIITNKTDDTWKIQYNANSPRFLVYTSNQAPIMLVKKSGGPVVPVESIELSEDALVLESGETYTLTAEVRPEDATEKGVNWSSSNSEIVSVDSNGNLTAGLLNVTSTATITATTQGETEQGEHLSATCLITVEKQHGPAIKLSASHLSLRVGDTARLTAKYIQTNVANGDLAIALGHSNTVSGNCSVAVGNNLNIARPEQVVIGKYNRNKDDTIFEVGNGTSENRSNALEVYADGSVRVYKSPSNNNDIANKNYVDNIPLKTINNESIKGSGNIDIQSGIQYGYYVNNGYNKLIYIGEDEVPQDYQGIAYDFEPDGLYIEYYENGDFVNNTYYGYDGASEVRPSALDGLTHSFDELDSTLKAIVDDAIDGGSTSCTEQQWNTIKQLLDKTLYLSYEGLSLIKGASNGIDTYMFGCRGANYGYTFEIYYDVPSTTLNMYYEEL